jgi:hypothetical protein
VASVTQGYQAYKETDGGIPFVRHTYRGIALVRSRAGDRGDSCSGQEHYQGGFFEIHVGSSNSIFLPDRLLGHSQTDVRIEYRLAQWVAGANSWGTKVPVRASVLWRWF